MNITATFPATEQTTNKINPPGLISKELWNFFLLKEKAKNKTPKKKPIRHLDN
jgi:hypothetical protein